jgi:hypothetical protein
MGPFDDNFMIVPISGINHERINVMTKNENKISNNLLRAKL